jgi:acylphosphatase
MASDSPASTVRLYAVVEGFVQGVGFRQFVLYACLDMGLSGWVRNRWDGSVEVLAEGERVALEKLVTILERGPRSAQVSGVHTEWSPATGEYAGFNVRSTSV